MSFYSMVYTNSNKILTILNSGKENLTLGTILLLMRFIPVSIYALSTIQVYEYLKKIFMHAKSVFANN